MRFLLVETGIENGVLDPFLIEELAQQFGLFDRNRTYVALGYSLSDNIRLQFGYMHQETDNLGKGQLQFNLFHRF